MARILHLIVAFFIVSAFVTSQNQADDKPSKSSEIEPIPTISNQLSIRQHKTKRHNSNKLSLLPNHFSGTNLRHWYHQFRQVVTNGCSYVIYYGPRIHRFLSGAKHDEKEERAQWEQLTVGYDAAQRAAVGATLHTISTTPDFSVSIYRSTAQKTKDAAARVGMSLDEVPYPALWLEGLVRSTESLPSLSLPSPPSWPDAVSLLSPLTWCAIFWRWWWRRTVSWTWMIICLTGGVLYFKLWRGLGIWSCLSALVWLWLLCYMCSIYSMVEAVFSFFLD